MWIVIARDNDVPGYLVFYVRATCNLLARERIKEEYKKQGWGKPADVDAYAIPHFRGNQDAKQICRVLDARPEPVQDEISGIPRVEYV